MTADGVPFTTLELAEVQRELMRIAVEGGERNRDAVQAVLRRMVELDPSGAYIAVGLALGFGLTIAGLTGLVPDVAGEGWGWEIIDEQTGLTVDDPDAIALGERGRGIVAGMRVVMACANGELETARDLALASCAGGADSMAWLLFGLMHIYRGARVHGATLWE